MTPASIRIEEDSHFFSGDNVYNWAAPGGVARITLSVRNFHHGAARISVFDATGLTLFRRTYRTFDYFFHFGGFGYFYAHDDDFVDLAFTDAAAAGLWTIVIEYTQFTGDVDLMIEDLATASPTPGFTPTASPATAPAIVDPGPIRRNSIVDSAGRTIVAGTRISPAGDRTLTVARYASDGRLDPSFGAAGEFVYRGAAQSAGFDLAHGDEHILVSGWAAADPDDLDLIVLRIDSAGALDPSFGAGGVVAFDEGASEVGLAVGVDADGRVTVAGASQADDPDDSLLTVLRFTAGGQLDPSFGLDGVFQSDGSTARCCDLALDSRGRTFVVGANGDAMAIWCLTKQGVLDPSFGKLGRVTDHGTPGVFRIAHDIDIQSDGEILVSGIEFTDSDVDTPVGVRWRFSSDGATLDD